MLGCFNAIVFVKNLFSAKERSKDFLLKFYLTMCIGEMTFQNARSLWRKSKEKYTEIDN